MEGWRTGRLEGQKVGSLEGLKVGSFPSKLSATGAKQGVRSLPVKSVSSRQSTYQSHNFVSTMMTPQVEPVNVVLAFSTRCPWVSLGGIGQAERSDDC